MVVYTYITGHFIFDINLGENFRGKARYCMDGHQADAPSSVLGKVYYLKSINGLLMHARCAQYGTCWRNNLCRMCVFCTYIFWCQLTHLHECWRPSMECFHPNASELKAFLTHKLVYCGTLFHDRTNVRIFPDGKVFIHIIPYINTERWYLRVICRGGVFILSVTFLIIIYLKDY